MGMPKLIIVTQQGMQGFLTFVLVLSEGCEGSPGGILTKERKQTNHSQTKKLK
jgi:hypothetical protein